jgi:hypothetical protein
MDILRTLVVLLVAGGILFVVYAWAKGWLKGAAGRGSFTSQVIMHDLVEKSKQRAMEYHMDKQEEKEKKDALSGDDQEPGQKKGNEDTS